MASWALQSPLEFTLSVWALVLSQSQSSGIGLTLADSGLHGYWKSSDEDGIYVQGDRLVLHVALVLQQIP